MSAPLNHRQRLRLLRVSAAATAGVDPPLAAVLTFGNKGHGGWWRALAAVAIAASVHVVLAAVAASSRPAIGPGAPRAARELVATLERPRVAPTPLAARVQSPIAARAAATPRPARMARAVPPAPAQAGKVIAAAPDAAAPADLTQFNLVVGEGASYAGGLSSGRGASVRAVESPTAAIGGKPDQLPAGARDESRAAAPLHRDWSCPWPDEEQTTDLRDARVVIRVHVDSDGIPIDTDVIESPPGGFAVAAVRCAQGERFQSARDSRGRAIPAVTAPFRVQFIR